MAAADVSAHDATCPWTSAAPGGPAELAVRCRRKRTNTLNITNRQRLPSHRAAGPKILTSLTYDNLPRLDIIQALAPEVAAALTCGDLPQLNLTKEQTSVVAVSTTYEHLPQVDLTDDWFRQLSVSTAGKLTYDELPPIGEVACEQVTREIVQKSPAATAFEQMKVEDDQAQAPLWSDEPNLAISRFVHRATNLRPQETLQIVKSFFQSNSVPYDIQPGTNEWTLDGIAFLDFVAVDFSVSIFTGGQGGSVTVFFRTGGSDVVLFAQLVELVVGHLAGGVAGPPRKLLRMDVEFDEFDEFDDFDSEEEGDGLMDWDARVLYVLKDARSGPDALQEAWKTLALWGAHSVESRPYLARVLCSEQGISLVASALQAEQNNQARVLYPMAAALKFASLAVGTAGLVVDELLPLLRAADHLPGLVARELEEAADNFQASV